MGSGDFLRKNFWFVRPIDAIDTPLDSYRRGAPFVCRTHPLIPYGLKVMLILLKRGTLFFAKQKSAKWTASTGQPHRICRQRALHASFDCSIRTSQFYLGNVNHGQKRSELHGFFIFFASFLHKWAISKPHPWISLDERTHCFRQKTVHHETSVRTAWFFSFIFAIDFQRNFYHKIFIL